MIALSRPSRPSLAQEGAPFPRKTRYSALVDIKTIAVTLSVLGSGATLAACVGAPKGGPKDSKEVEKAGAATAKKDDPNAKAGDAAHAKAGDAKQAGEGACGEGGCGEGACGGKPKAGDAKAGDAAHAKAGDAKKAGEGACGEGGCGGKAKPEHGAKKSPES